MLIRKHTRQPHARKASSGSRLAIEKAPEASSSPPGTPMCAADPKKPRRSAGAYSTASSTAPPYSPPTPMPCSTRSATSRIGAHTPMESYDGSRPISAVPTPMISSVRISIFLRPIRSPKWPNSRPPIGPGQEPDREGAEGRELRRRSVEAVEEELVEDETGGGAVEEEVVPLDGGAHRRGDGDPSGCGAVGHLGRRGRRAAGLRGWSWRVSSRD